jgi:hypothetical protein
MLALLSRTKAQKVPIPDSQCPPAFAHVIIANRNYEELLSETTLNFSKPRKEAKLDSHELVCRVGYI